MTTDKELLQQALDVMEAAIKAGDWKVDGACDPDWVLNALRARLSQCDRCGEVNPAEIHTCTPKEHWSDCAVHSEPAYPAGECDCGGVSPEQEPVAWWHDRNGFFYLNVSGHGTPLYFAPPQREEGCAECGKKASDGWALYCVKCSEPLREWVGLTDEEIDEAYQYWSDPSRSAYGGANSADGEYVCMAETWRYIEAKLKAKNYD